MAYKKELWFPTTWSIIKSTDADESFVDDIAHSSTSTSNTHEVWSNTSVAVFKFKPFPLNVAYSLMFGRIGIGGTLLTTHSDLPNGIGTSTVSGMGLDIVYDDDIGVSGGARLHMQAIPIYADFNINTLTWNSRAADLDEGDPLSLWSMNMNYTAPTFVGGADVAEGFRSDEAFSPTQIDGMIFCPDSEIDTDAGEIAEPGLKFPTASGKSAVYGVILEVQLSLTRFSSTYYDYTAEGWLSMQPDTG